MKKLLLTFSFIIFILSLSIAKVYAATTSIQVNQHVSSTSNNQTHSKITIHLEQNGQVTHQVWENGQQVNQSSGTNSTPSPTAPSSNQVKSKIAAMKQKMKERIDALKKRMQERKKNFGLSI